MKISKLRKFWLSTSLMLLLIACNNRTSEANIKHDTSGINNPVIINPSTKDTLKQHQTKVGSPNEEYDQHKIDSIKQNKLKPKDRKGGRND